MPRHLKKTFEASLPKPRVVAETARICEGECPQASDCDMLTDVILTEICDRHCKCTEGSPYIPFSTDCALKYPRRLRSSTACIVCAIRLMQCELSSNTRVYIQVCCGELSDIGDCIPPKLLFCFQTSTATVTVHYAVHPTRNSRHTETSLAVVHP